MEKGSYQGSSDLPEVRDRIVAEIERRREEEQHDRMWGEGNWIVHEGCPDALEAGQERAIHHKEYHCD